MKSITDYRCEFVISDLNSNLAYCRICNRVILTTNKLEDKGLCAIKLHKASIDPADTMVQLIKTEEIVSPEIQTSERIKCSQEQIDDRMNICQTCPFFQDNTCLQCGCALSRDRNYKNKLYFADQACPIGKWGTIV